MRKFFLLVMLWLPLFAGWNEDFDAESHQVFDHYPYLQNGLYSQYYEFFTGIRETLLKDTSLCKRYKKCSAGDKFQIRDFERGLVIKKRPKQRIHEFYVWELSQFLGASEFIVPSFPIEIQGTKVIVQAMEEFVIGKEEKKIPPKAFLDKVSLFDYWKSHLAAYLLGLGDLVGMNIGINTLGKIRFFDAESSLRYHNEPIRSDRYFFKVGFLMESFEWPHYRKPLNAKEVCALKEFVQGLAFFQASLGAYQSLRSFPIDEGLLYRLERVRSFPLQEGASFRDFYGYLFPHMNQGLDKLNDLVSNILERKVDHAASLFFASRRRSNYSLSQQETTALQEWIRQYIGED